MQHVTVTWRCQVRSGTLLITGLGSGKDIGLGVGGVALLELLADGKLSSKNATFGAENPCFCENLGGEFEYRATVIYVPSKLEAPRTKRRRHPV